MYKNGRRFGFFSIDTAAHILASGLKGLVFLHGMGVYHLDVKGGNLLVFPDGKVKLGM